MILCYPGSPTNSYYLSSTSSYVLAQSLANARGSSLHLCFFPYPFLERASSLDLSFFTSYEQLSASYSHVDPLEVTTCKDKTSGTYLAVHGWDFMLPVQGAWVQSPHQGTRSHVPQLRPGAAKLIKKRKSFLSDSVHLSCRSISHHSAFLFPPSECSWLMEHVVVTFSHSHPRVKLDSLRNTDNVQWDSHLMFWNQRDSLIFHQGLLSWWPLPLKL